VSSGSSVKPTPELAFRIPARVVAVVQLEPHQYLWERD
jgi:hypothetical protein